jgi:hypothetical protein
MQEFGMNVTSDEEQVAGSYKHGKERSRWIKKWEFLIS